MREFLKKWMKYFLTAGFFSAFINTLYLTFPIYMLAIYLRVMKSYSVPTLVTITTGALLALLVLGILDFLRSRLLVQAGVDMDRSLSRPVLAEMMRDASRYNRSGYSEGLKDVNTLRNYFAGNAILALFDGPWIPIYLLVIYLMNPILGLVATAGAILLIVIGLLQGYVTRKRYDTAHAIQTENQQFINAGMRNSEVVNSMGMLEGIVEQWKEKNNEQLRLQTQANRYGGALQSISKSIRLAMQVIIFGSGAYLVLQNQASTGIIIAASIIMGRALAPIQQCMGTWRQTVEARAAYKRLDNLLRSIPEGEQSGLPAPQGNLEAEGVSLTLGGGYVLRNVAFKLQAGEIMGLIGPSGAGKTCLCRVLLGIWPSVAEKVRLDGVDVYEWDQLELGPYIGYLPQDVALFPGTVSENIARMGEVDSDKVIEAAKMAHAHEFILRLPNGYDTEIGEQGGNLSGGQRQRIGLARAFYGDPRFVVLDEPNSNLDDAGEKALMQALEQLKQNGVTAIIVTHKPSLLSAADKIMMLKEGQISMFGPRQEVFQRLSGQQGQQQQAAGKSTTQG